MGEIPDKKRTDTAPGPAIRLQSVSRVYRGFWRVRRTWALRELSLVVKRGEIFGLLGPNGSGKTTALKIIVGLIRATSGDVRVLDRGPGDTRTLARVGYLPEEPAHYGFLNARESLEFYGKLFRLDRQERRQRAKELIEKLGFEGQGSRPVREYSRGMARRLGIAQALINRPDLLVLDEPTSGLDPVAHRLVTDLFVRLREEGKSILISSHLLADVEKVCDRIGILGQGRLLLEGSVGELLDDPEAIDLVLEGIGEEAAREAVEAAGGQVRSSRPARQTLHDLFLQALKKGRRR
ncbi:MAG: ABC transporter ATP-binding protein [Planctomycetota bacterium]|nr:ABC transporter ATP-binding protein [Planctomycetota bacterium]